MLSFFLKNANKNDQRGVLCSPGRRGRQRVFERGRERGDKEGRVRRTGLNTNTKRLVSSGRVWLRRPAGCARTSVGGPGVATAVASLAAGLLSRWWWCTCGRTAWRDMCRCLCFRALYAAARRPCWRCWWRRRASPSRCAWPARPSSAPWAAPGSGRWCGCPGSRPWPATAIGLSLARELSPHSRATPFIACDRCSSHRTRASLEQVSSAAEATPFHALQLYLVVVAAVVKVVLVHVRLGPVPVQVGSLLAAGSLGRGGRRLGRRCRSFSRNLQSGNLVRHLVLDLWRAEASFFHLFI